MLINIYETKIAFTVGLVIPMFSYGKNISVEKTVL
jgi:hypothetical protein